MSYTHNVSIIIPVRNQKKFISRCIRSLLAQHLDRKKYEIIVIDDSSEDNTLEELEKFSNQIILLKNKTHLGLPKSLNLGIRAAKGNYIVRVDSDDFVSNDFLLFLYRFLEENPHYDAIACDYNLVDDEENIIKRMSSKQDPIACGIMFKKEHLLAVGLYDENFLRHEDKEFRIRYEKEYKIQHIEIPLYRYRQHSSNITKDHKLMNYYEKKLKKKHD